MTKKYRETIEQKIVIGFFCGLWWLLTLPFRGLRKNPKISLEDQKYIISKRREIESLKLSGKNIELKHAVMEADKLVDYILKKKGFSGKTFADRLLDSQKFFSPIVYNDIWQGHKIRNQLAHEDVEISSHKLREATDKLLGAIR